MADRQYRRQSVEEEVVAPNTVAEDRYVDAAGDVREERVVRRDSVAAPVATDSMVTERTVGTRYYDSLPARVNTVLLAIGFAIEGLLALRFLLVAFGASRTSGFVDFILNVSWPFVRPFSNAFSNRTWDKGIVEINTLLAMGVWFLGFAVLAMLINALLPRYDASGERIHRERVTHS